MNFHGSSYMRLNMLLSGNKEIHPDLQVGFLRSKRLDATVKQKVDKPEVISGQDLKVE